MAFSPLSFAIGMGVAYVVPILTKTFRPLAVEATAMGLGLFEDVRRIVAEQMENLEDIAAEARARREEIALGSAVDDGDDADETLAGPDARQRGRAPIQRHAGAPAVAQQDPRPERLITHGGPTASRSGGPTWSASFTTFRAGFACDCRRPRTVRARRNACEAWPESSTAPGRLAPRDC